MGVIREFGGQTDLLFVFWGSMIFILVFIYDIFFAKFSWFLLNVYTHMCLYLQWSTFRIYAMSPIPHVILTVLILGFQKVI